MWYAKATGAYLTTDAEAIANALNIASLLQSVGFVKSAIAAILGNSQWESGLNPWRWQGDYVPTSNTFSGWSDAEALLHGYGLFQYTPAKKYINQQSSQDYSPEYAPHLADIQGNATDGHAQTLFLIDYIPSDWLHLLYQYYYQEFIQYGVDITPWYYTSFNNFKQGLDNNGNQLSLDALTGVFELSYERPNGADAAYSYQTRVNYANYWYNIIPTPTPPTPSKPMPWIYYLKHRRF